MMDFTAIYVLLGGFLLIGLGLVALYLLRALGLYRLAVNAGMSHPGLAWVPVANWYLLGCLCDRAGWWHSGKKWSFALWLPIVNAVGSPWLYLGLVELLPYSTSTRVSAWMVSSGLQGLLGMAATGLSAFALYYFYRDYAPGQETAYTVLSVLLAFAAPHVLLFLLRNRRPCSVTGVRPPTPPAGSGCYTTGPRQHPGGYQTGGGTTGWSAAPPPPAPPAGGQGAGPFNAGAPSQSAPPPAAPGWLPQEPTGGNRWQPGSSDGDFYQRGGPEDR